ncbi:MAG: type III-B CRISPR module RAMP protein Cmr6 [Chloroflexi bacterium]|nr:type III-B CRISPR module RAMP protein Cmr6 [Chloroflexota bacterium]
MTGYPIPPATARAWERHRAATPQNPGLVFDRFGPDWAEAATLKRDGLAAVAAASERADVALLRAWNDRWTAAVRAADAEPFALATEWRLVTGLGRKGALEVGFTFHRYGFPILPGSGVKGVARALGLVAVAEQLGAQNLGLLDDLLSLGEEEKFRQRLEQQHGATTEAARTLARHYRAIFGTTAGAGHAIFFDAIPSRLPRLALDIMNPHYPEYYGDATARVAPTDWQSPRPVYFLTVAEATEFRFAVGWRGRLDDDGYTLRDLARTWLGRGLAELGAGAKTGAGYGYFVGLPAPVPTERPPVRALPAPGLPASKPTAPPEMVEPPVLRQGVILEIRPDKRFGRVRDDETGQVYRFATTAVRGSTPGNKGRVVFELRGATVVSIRRA